jgi:glycosyltransferase involved in cell wall biosynthesis
MAEWHLVTAEYPPQVGGVADYARLVAEGLAAAGDRVHVWCSAQAAGEGGESCPDGNEPRREGGVRVHRVAGGFTPAGLWRQGRELNRFAGPRRLLVQYVPHGFGYRSMNVALCLWLWWRAGVRGDEVEVVVHEPFLEFRRGAWRQSAAAAVHRVMAALLLRAARRAWVVIPAWRELWRPLAFGKRVGFEWLPVPSTIPVGDDRGRVSAVRARYAPRAGDLLVGHFGTYGPHTADALLRLLPRLLSEHGGASVLLLGRGGERLRDELRRRHEALAGRVHAAGALPAEELSYCLSACDMMVQPYVDGVSSRRTSVMAGLAHGLPVVTTGGRLTEPLWAESGAVALAAAGDDAALARRAGRLLDDAAERRRLGEAGRELYRKHFDAAHTIAALRRGDRAARESAAEAVLAR